MIFKKFEQQKIVIFIRAKCENFDIFGNTQNKKLSFLSERKVKIWYYWEHEEQKIGIFIRAECENLTFLGIRRTKNCHLYQSGWCKFDIIANTKNKKLSFLSERSVKFWLFWEWHEPISLCGLIKMTNFCCLYPTNMKFFTLRSSDDHE